MKIGTWLHHYRNARENLAVKKEAKHQSISILPRSIVQVAPTLHAAKLDLSRETHASRTNSV